MTIPERGSLKKKPGKSAPTQPCETGKAHEVKRSDKALLANLRDGLRMPVNAVIEYSEMLLEDANKQGHADFIPDLMKIHSLGKKLLALVHDRLDETTLDEAMTDKEWDVFNVNLRHELRTPLNAIIGYSELLLEDAAADGPEGFIPDLEKIRSACKLFLSFIEDIAGFSRIKHGAADPAFCHSDASSMVRSVMNDIPPLEEARPCLDAANRGSLLVIDDNATSRDLMRRQLERQGHTVTVAENGQQALEIMQAGTFDMVLLDLMMPGMSGYQVLQLLKSSDVYRDVPVIVISALDDLDSVVRCIRMGAEDYLLKPFNPVLLKARIRTCLENKRLRELSEALELRNLKEEVQLVAESRAMQQVLGTMRAVSRNPVNVLIQGESGTGKEVIARMIHHYSNRKDKPFVAVNCASIPENLMESEFFGYEKGAFTGAIASRRGYFEEASGGTLFLDEIGDMNAGIQAKLLRVLQEKTLERVGGSGQIAVDTRVVAATNRDLELMMRQGDFREDLYYRLNVFPIRLPPLRERPEDIPLLAEHALRQHTGLAGGRVRAIAPQALSAMMRYRWPGNIRELENVIKRSIINCPGDAITQVDLPEPEGDAAPRDGQAQPEESMPFKEYLSALTRDAEERYLRRMLRLSHGNINKVARLMELDRKTVYRKMADYKISPEEFRE